jgi:hypothetical protein
MRHAVACLQARHSPVDHSTSAVGDRTGVRQTGSDRGCDSQRSLICRHWGLAFVAYTRHPRMPRLATNTLLTYHVEVRISTDG